MRTSFRYLIFALTVMLTITCRVGPVYCAASGLPTDQKGSANPDPDHIQESSGNKIIKVLPRNDAEDFRNLQWALDNTEAGGTVLLESGTFFLGDGDLSPRRTVWMRRGVKVVGKKDGDHWLSVIRGGGEVLTPGVGGALESGPFRIAIEKGDHPAVFEELWFREWACEVIFIVSCPGFEFRRCRISHPVTTALPARVRYVHALWTTGLRARGNFTAENCLVELGRYKGPAADDEQFLGVFFSNHDTIRVVNNVITGLDEAIEILGNRYGLNGPGDPAAARGPSEIMVTGNRIDVTGQPGDNWPSSFAMLIGGNLNVDRVRIENNQVVKRGKGWGLAISGENLSIKGNRFRFEVFEGKFPPGAVIIGIGRFPVRLGGLDMGISLTHSVFTHNTFEGKVEKIGLFFSPGQGKDLNASHENLFDLGESLAGLGAETTLMLSKEIRNNTFKGNLGKIIDNSPKGANQY